MKTPLRILLLLLLSWFGLGKTASWAQTAITPFSCDGTFYQVRQSGTGASAFSVLYKVNRSTTTYTTSPLTGGTYGTTGSLGTGVVVNGLAYNSQDGYMYALTYPADNGTPTVVPRLYKIGSDGIQDLGATNLPVQQFATGTFDKTGHYYVTTRNNTDATYRNVIFRFDLNSATPRSATQLPLQTTAGAAPNVNFFDVAYNPSDDNLYGVFTNLGLIYKIVIDNPSTPTKGTVTSIGTAGTAVTLGSNFFDVAGNMYAYSNEGNFYAVDVQNGAATLLSTVAAVSNSDGASCINPDQRIDVVKEVTSISAVNATTFDIDFAIRVKNTSTATDQNVQINDFLWSGTSGTVLANTTFSSTSGKTASNVQITVAPTLTADPKNSNPTLALAIKSGFTGVGTNSQLLTGTQSLTAGQAATISFRVRVTYPNAAGVPGTGLANGQPFNTAYATSTADSNPGYSQNTSTGSLFPPDNLQASDISTNSGALPAVANGDAASPSPILYATAIVGNVFEDINYGGGAGRSQIASQGEGVTGARVELYSSIGAYLGFTTTDAAGNYSFVNGVNSITLTGSTTYRVRVVNSSVVSNRPGSIAGLLPVQTFLNGDVNRVGGENPNEVDYGNNTTTLPLSAASTTNEIQTVTPLTGTGSVTTPASGPVISVDFGFNFSTVVNTNNSGQGSLRQFILNSNALTNQTLNQDAFNGTAAAGTTATTPAAGTEYAIFMLNDGRLTGAPAGLRNAMPTTSGYSATSKAFTFALFTLPTITDSYTAIDGKLQTILTGDNVSATPNTTGAEIVLDFTTATQGGLLVTGSNTRIASINVTNAGVAAGSRDLDITNPVLADGAAITFTGAGATGSVVTDVTGQNNTISSVLLQGGATGITISNNVFRTGRITAATSTTIAYDGAGILLSNASGNTISGNTISSNNGFGIELRSNSNSNTISG